MKIVFTIMANEMNCKNFSKKYESLIPDYLNVENE